MPCICGDHADGGARDGKDEAAPENEEDNRIVVRRRVRGGNAGMNLAARMVTRNIVTYHSWKSLPLLPILYAVRSWSC